jgi:hypothetical protein
MFERRHRFLNLEKRRETAGVASSPSTASPAAVETALVNQLREQRAQAVASGLALETEAGEAQPFVRCGVCETDAGRFETQCRTCAADLNTPEQNAFNARLWGQLRAEAKAEAEAQAELARTRAAAIDQERLQISQYAAEMERHQALNGAEGASVGSRLLHLISNARVRLGVALVFLGLGCFALYHWIRAPRAPGLNPWEVVFLVIAVLFLPTSYWRPWSRWWRGS